jgi:hypothetical protein
MSLHRKVFLIKEGVYADLIAEGAYASRVRYMYGGVMFDVLVENDDYEMLYDDWENEE